MLIVIFVLLSSILLGSAVNVTRPHIVFILADDLGWNDVSFHGSRQIPTPNLDALAYDGVLLSNYYTQPICTPTRGAILTARYPIHTGLQHNVICGSQPFGLPLNETLMPQYLKQIGYRTHMVGKWHLGFYTPAHTPTHRGFDTFYGYFNGEEDYWEHTSDGSEPGNKKNTWGLDFHRNDAVEKTAYGRYSTEIFGAEAVNIINNHPTDEPLYLYLPFQAVHSANPWQPLQTPAEYYDKFSHITDHNRRIFAGMVSALDNAVGLVLGALVNNSLVNDTIIVFSTDNGGPPAGFDMNAASNYPLRGTKESLWEGGIRGDGFVWSAKLSPYVYRGLMHVTDWLPTLLSAAGYDISRLPANLDGFNQWQHLTNREQKSERREILHNIDNIDGEWAIRQDDMKFVFGKSTTRGWSGWYGPSGTHRHRHRMSPESERHEPAPEHLFHSPVRNILKKLGRSLVGENRPYEVECGEKPSNASSNCRVWEKACLYNITADPCEYNNLAGQLPEVVDRLMARLQEYNATAVPPANKPDDPAGFPSRNGGIWRPWRDL